jgi:hypothetical protein
MEVLLLEVVVSGLQVLMVVMGVVLSSAGRGQAMHSGSRSKCGSGGVQQEGGAVGSIVGAWWWWRSTLGVHGGQSDAVRASARAPTRSEDRSDAFRWIMVVGPFSEPRAFASPQVTAGSATDGARRRRVARRRAFEFVVSCARVSLTSAPRAMVPRAAVVPSARAV